MASENKIKLLSEQIKKLETLPEQGMGYQIVDIKLKSGKELKNRVVLNSSYLLLHDDERLNSNEIIDVNLHV